MEVREAALDRFGPATIRTGQPLALLEEVLVPLYLRHRYQVDATTKVLGGVTYEYALRGDALEHPEPVSGTAQRAALDALLATITPEALRVPENARLLIAPRPPGYPSNRELFQGRTGLTFDPYAPAEVAAAMVLSGLIHPERAARLVYQNDTNASLPGLVSVLERIDAQVWDNPRARDAYDAELQRLVQQVWTDVLMETAMDDNAAPAVRARLTKNLHNRRDWLQNNPGVGDAERSAHRTLIHGQINRYLNRQPDSDAAPSMLPAPPGSPIGQDNFRFRQSQRRALLNHWSAEACAVSDT